MCLNKKNLFLIFFLLLLSKANSSEKNNIIENLKNLKNFTFQFEQNINEKTESGKCTIEYPKKIKCTYNSSNNKILISNGKSLVIKTDTSYFIYPINKTPFNFILDKNYLLKKIKRLDERIVSDKFINYVFSENDNEMNLFFDKKTFYLIGWQTKDIYQNLSITYINIIDINRNLEKNLFKIPKQN